ncbi:MAG TPA: alpha/beta hydrolase [Gammaproteobacteria bacterium]|nr:alpha/beta hydrolase [Gammaproteobacteria bacterium]
MGSGESILNIINRYLTANNHRLYAHLIGDVTAGKPALVFMHDGLGCIEMWRDLPEKVVSMTGLPALIYDRWGYGKSDTLTEPRQLNYRHVEALQTLPAVLDEFNIDSFILIGHSDGGAMSLLAASEFTERVLAVATFAPQVAIPDQMQSDMHKTMQAFESGKLKGALEKYHGDNTVSMFYGWANAWSSDAFKTWNMTEEFTKIRCPVLTIVGARDEYGYQHNLDAIEAGVSAPLKQLVLPTAGHAPHQDEPDTILAEIKSLLQTAGVL